MFINYLVYLEGLATLVLNDMMKLDHIDDLMAFRFFLAVNNPELQKAQLAVFPQFYRGCFKLYRKWTEYYEEMLGLAAKKGVDTDDEQVRQIAESYFRWKYDEPGSEDMLFLINVCVSPDFRGMGIASEMLGSFIGEHGGAPMELCVIADNERAVTLYRNHGFSITRKEKGFSPDDEKPPVYSMKRKPAAMI